MTHGKTASNMDIFTTSNTRLYFLLVILAISIPELLTTNVRRQRVPAGDRGSRAACKSHTLILLLVFFLKRERERKKSQINSHELSVPLIILQK